MKGEETSWRSNTETLCSPERETQAVKVSVSEHQPLRQLNYLFGDLYPIYSSDFFPSSARSLGDIILGHYFFCQGSHLCDICLQKTSSPALLDEGACIDEEVPCFHCCLENYFLNSIRN